MQNQLFYHFVIILILLLILEESVIALEDYRQAFGKAPPAMAGIAFMSDMDNTGDIAVAYLDFIKVGRDR